MAGQQQTGTLVFDSLPTGRMTGRGPEGPPPARQTV